MSSRSQRRSSTSSVRVVLILLIAGMFLLIGLCCGAYSLVDRVLNSEGAAETPAVAKPALTVAYSPEKEPVFTALVDRFNALGLETPDGESALVRTVQLDPEGMMNAVLDGDAEFQAMTPDSSVWLGQLDSAWSRQALSQDADVVGETVRYAVSPVVIAMWEGIAREMGWPDAAVSWQNLLDRAQTDPDFRWSHPSTASASGLLATLAQFYAGAGKERGLTIEDVQAQTTLDYVAELQQTVQYYGEGDEPAIIQRALEGGRAFLDAFVVQEQMVVYHNTHPDALDRLVAVYPAEGTLWEDHPLALLETADVDAYQRHVFALFRDYLFSPEAQELIISYGYRPADYAIPLDGPDSPLTATNGVDPSEPKTSLQVPNASVIEVVRDVWWYTKRHTNVYLVVDTSGSMHGEKLSQAQSALRAFLDQIRGDEERVGLIEFSSFVYTVVPLDKLGNNRSALELSVEQLEAEGDTALLDAVYEAYSQLQAFGDTSRINAVVVMTDGRENYSDMSLRQLVREIGQNTIVPTVIFAIAYGDDADMTTLWAIADPTGGQVREGDLETIENLYRVLSTYF